MITLNGRLPRNNALEIILYTGLEQLRENALKIKWQEILLTSRKSFKSSASPDVCFFIIIKWRKSRKMIQISKKLDWEIKLEDWHGTIATRKFFIRSYFKLGNEIHRTGFSRISLSALNGQCWESLEFCSTFHHCIARCCWKQWKRVARKTRLHLSCELLMVSMSSCQQKLSVELACWSAKFNKITSHYAELSYVKSVEKSWKKARARGKENLLPMKI